MWAWSLGLTLVSGLVGGTGVGCGSSFVAGFGGGLLGVIHRLAHLALELGVQRLALLDRNLTLLDEFVDELAALLVSGGKGSDARQQDLAQAITQKIIMSRILAIDYGRKRTGVAVSDAMQIIANGLTTVPTHELLDFITGYVQKEPVERILVGLPKQMNNEASESMKYIDPFVRSLKKRLPEIPVEFVDERFTSVLAHRTMLEAGLKKKDRQNKALVDEISATIILQTYLESKRF